MSEVEMPDKPQILIVENDRSCQILYEGFLRPQFDVHTAKTSEAREAIDSDNYAGIVANSHNRYGGHLAMDGFGLLRYARSRGHVTPFIFLVEAADELALREADSYGAFEVIPKGVANFELRLVNSITIATSFYEYRLSQIKQRHDGVFEVLGQFQNVTPINWDYRDENLYQAFFEIDGRRNKFCYANNWAYICQAARCNGHKFFDGNALITVQASRKGSEYEFEIIRPVGKQATKKSFDLAQKLKALTRRPVIFRRLEPDQVENLLMRGCLRLETPDRGNLDDYMEDMYPQVVIDLRRFAFNLSLPEMAWFRRGLRQFTRRNYTMQDMKPSMFEDVLEVLSRWKPGFVGRYEKREQFKNIPQNDSYYFDPYLPFVEHFGKSRKRNHTIATLFYIDDEPVGFSFYARISDCCLAMYANVGDIYFDGLSYFMLYQNFLRALWAGYTHVNLGGTETKSLFDFYSRLAGNAQAISQSLQALPSRDLILNRMNLML